MSISIFKNNRVISFTIVSAAYAVALLLGYYSLGFFHNFSLLWQVFFADVIATCIIFLFSIIFKNSSIYDPYWSVIPPFIVIFWMFHSPAEANEIRQMIILLLVSLWAVRLTLNWARGWQNLHHEDWRYRQLAQKTGNLYWLVSFLGIHLFPTVIVFLGCLPLTYSLYREDPLGATDLVASVVTFCAIVVETIADEQLKIFKKKTGAGLMDKGIWAYSRHPNYLGEISFWLGMFLFAVGGRSGYEWTSVGFIAMVILFVFISIPMMEKRMVAKRPDFVEYRKRVSMLIPLPKKLL